MAPVRERVDQVTHSPVFVDESGRRRRWVTWTLAAAAAACTGYLVLLAFSFAGGPLTPHDLLPWPDDDRSSRPQRFEPQDPAGTPSPDDAATAATEPSPAATGGASGGASATASATVSATASAGTPTTAPTGPTAASPPASPSASVSASASASGSAPATASEEADGPPPTSPGG